jgi:2-polyprenyl-3-methyl-5-hydroxy-6-metoxy-1,4-benzoquinol methylase
MAEGIVKRVHRPREWTRKASLDSARASRTTEIWECRDRQDQGLTFEVDVTIGKPLDVLALKGTSLTEIEQYASFLQSVAVKLYGPRSTAKRVASCPCCDESVTSTHVAASIFGVAYNRCHGCGHVFVGSQPDPGVLLEVFAESEGHAAAYTDSKQVEFRLAEVIKPKVDWMLEVYQGQYGGQPRTVLDVGAGGGHFVEACRRAGLKAEGYEVSKASRQFAREAFGIELRSQDFLSEIDRSEEFDVVTFWGLLEYTPEPRRYLQAAYDCLRKAQGMLVAEVPRFDCLGTAVQRLCPEAVARHLDPTSHVNCFSDASLATALITTGFKPVAAWYFGMDAYELVVQLALRLGDPAAVERLAPWIPELQASLDAAKLCDDVIVAALPMR